MKLLPKFLITILLASLVIVGCSQQPAATTPQTNDAQTAVASTLAVMQTQIAEAASSTESTEAAATEAATEAPTVEPTAVATEVTVPTAEPTAAATATAVVITNPAAVSSGPSYRVGDVQDLNYPDGTYMDATMYFTKQWSIKNVGTGTWPADTKVVAVDSNPLQAGTYTIGQVVSPGQSVTIRLPLRAPETVAKYKGKFMLELPDGTRFGIGANFDQPFWVEIYTH